MSTRHFVLIIKVIIIPFHNLKIYKDILKIKVSEILKHNPYEHISKKLLM